MSRAAELALDLLLLGAVVALALRSTVVLLVLGVFLAVSICLMLVERAVR